MNGTTPLDGALHLAELGYRVFPCDPERPGEPCRGVLWRREATDDAAAVRRLWARFPAGQPSIACGESGIVVIDIDTGIKDGRERHGEAGWATLDAPEPVVEYRTRHGGRHLIYAEGRAVIGNSASVVAPDVDVRGLGGYVVCHDPYAVTVSPQGLSPVPEEVVAALASRRREGPTMDSPASERDPFAGPGRRFTMDEATTYVRTEAIDRLRTAVPGGRNHALNAAAMVFGHFVPLFWSVEQVLEGLAGIAAEIGLSSAEIEPTIRSGLKAGMRDPYEIVQTEVDQGRKQPEAERSSWEAEDLAAILAGTFEPEVPTLFPRDDAVHLLYPRRVHSFHGESESGKSMVAQAECARVLRDTDGTACYVDFESDAATVVGRLLAMGAQPDAVAARFRYIRPDVKPDTSERDRTAYEGLMVQPCDVIVVDGVTEGMGVFGVQSGRSEDEVSQWVRWFPRRLARATGAAVVLIDHVVKNADTRGRFAIGSQAKMAGLDGAAYTVEIRRPLGRGMRGAVSLRVAKDRPGGVRPQCGQYRESDRTQEAAYVIVDSSDDGRIKIEVRPPMQDDAQVRQDMETVSRFIEQNPECTQRKFASGRHASRLAHAASRLADLGFIKIQKRGNGFVHTSEIIFRADDQHEHDDSGIL